MCPVVVCFGVGFLISFFDMRRLISIAAILGGA